MDVSREAFRVDETSGGAGLWHFEGLARMEGVVHAVTPKGPWLLPADPEDSEHANRVEALAEALGLEAAAWLRQVHGARVLQAEEPGLLGEADALVCARPGLGILVRGADCPLILAASRGPRGTVVGAAHASWRGTVVRAGQRMVEALLARSGGAPGDLRAAIAPSAGPCCYQVGEEVRDAALASLGEAAGSHFTPQDGGLYFDLWAANRAQLEAVGGAPMHIETAGQCSICGNHRWPSWRAEGAAAGRMAAIIGIFES